MGYRANALSLRPRSFLIYWSISIRTVFPGLMRLFRLAANYDSTKLSKIREHFIAPFGRLGVARVTKQQVQKCNLQSFAIRSTSEVGAVFNSVFTIG